MRNLCVRFELFTSVLELKDTTQQTDGQHQGGLWHSALERLSLRS